MKKKKDALRYRKKVQLATEIYALMSEGMSDADIIENLGVSDQEYVICKKFMLESKGEEESNISRKERFAQYTILQNRNIKDLTDMILNLNQQKQFNAIVGAIRLRSDIADKIISIGQTLGIISKEPEKKLVLGGIAISEIDDKELKIGIVKAVADLGNMIKSYGAGKNLLDVPTGNIHHGEALALPENTTSSQISQGVVMVNKATDKNNKAKTGKRHAGRKRKRNTDG